MEKENRGQETDSVKPLTEIWVKYTGTLKPYGPGLLAPRKCTLTAEPLATGLRESREKTQRRFTK